MSPRLINEIDEANVSETTSQQTLVRSPARTESQKRRRKPKHALTRATGPRTPEGKQRSRCNATTHGIFAVGVLPRESVEDYYRLVNELAETLQPVGRLEELLVEKLAMLSWRYRRFVWAEAAAVESQAVSAEEENLELRTRITAVTTAGEGYLATARFSQNRIALAWARSALEELRERIKSEGFNWERDRETLGLIYGVRKLKKDSQALSEESEEEKISPEPLGRLAETYRQLVTEEDGEPRSHRARSSSTQGRRIILDLIEEELEEFEPLMDKWYCRDRDIRVRRAQARLVPRGEAAERLQRYEGSLERAFDRTLTQLERLQRMRLGQPVLPPLKVNLST